MHHITPTELKDKLDRGERPVMLDVRQPWEAKICSLPGSRNIPMGELAQRATELERGEEIVVYCHHGMRSAAVAGMLHHMGYARVLNLEGGISRWAHDIDPVMRQY